MDRRTMIGGLVTSVATLLGLGNSDSGRSDEDRIDWIDDRDRLPDLKDFNITIRQGDRECEAVRASDKVLLKVVGRNSVTYRFSVCLQLKMGGFRWAFTRNLGLPKSLFHDNLVVGWERDSGVDCFWVPLPMGG
jgi:hypothetical protein